MTADMETCGNCDGDGYHEVAAGHRQYGSKFEDCEERFDAVQCEDCEGEGQVPAEASDGE